MGGGPYPGGGPLPFIPGVYQPNNTIAQLILEAGRQRAEGQQRMFENIGHTAETLGQIPAQMQQMKLQEQRLAQEKAQTDLTKARAARESGEYDELQHH